LCERSFCEWRSGLRVKKEKREYGREGWGLRICILVIKNGMEFAGVFLWLDEELTSGR
jgi:hypothetical protein